MGERLAALSNPIVMLIGRNILPIPDPCDRHSLLQRRQLLFPTEVITNVPVVDLATIVRGAFGFLTKIVIATGALDP